jgi:hypothetical protein
MDKMAGCYDSRIDKDNTVGWQDSKEAGCQEGGMSGQQAAERTDAGWQDGRTEGGHDAGWQDGRTEGGHDAGWQDGRRA